MKKIKTFLLILFVGLSALAVECQAQINGNFTDLRVSSFKATPTTGVPISRLSVTTTSVTGLSAQLSLQRQFYIDGLNNGLSTIDLGYNVPQRTTISLSSTNSNGGGPKNVSLFLSPLDVSPFVVSASGISFPGIQYSSDYSANFTDRSLVDRGFVTGSSTIGTTQTDESLIQMALGGGLVAQSIPSFSASLSGSGSGLTDNTARYTAVWVPYNFTSTGAMFLMVTQGNFTGDQTNALALYSYSGGTLTKVAETANDQNIWKNAANAFVKVAWATPVAVTRGVYFVGAIYNNSAQVTAPTLLTAGSYVATTMATTDLTNSAKIRGTVAAQNSFPATQASTGITAVAGCSWFGIY